MTEHTPKSDAQGMQKNSAEDEYVLWRALQDETEALLRQMYNNGAHARCSCVDAVEMRLEAIKRWQNSVHHR